MELDTRLLLQHLKAKNHDPEMVLLKTITTSTNDDIRGIAAKGVTSALVCSAEQTKGRGQHQRPWISPQGNIYLSTLVQTKIALDGRLALEVALNLLQIPSLKSLELQVKWPNDLYSSQGKWGGILLEPLSTHQAIVGIGINLHTPESTVADQPITSLFDLGVKDIDRLRLIAEIYSAVQLAAEWFDHGCYNLANRFNHHTIWLNQHIIFEYSKGTIEGQYLGISNDGAVRLKVNHEIQSFYQGRLRLKPINHEDVL